MRINRKTNTPVNNGIRIVVYTLMIVLLILTLWNGYFFGKEKAMKANVYAMERKIKELTNKKTFWDDVREIVGFYDDTVFIEDWDIKRLQRVADARYEELV